MNDLSKLTFEKASYADRWYADQGKIVIEYSFATKQYTFKYKNQVYFHKTLSSCKKKAQLLWDQHLAAMRFREERR